LSSAARTILVTGFEPFGGETVNASWEAAQKLEGWRHGDTAAVARLLPCAYDRFAHNLDDATAPDNDGALRRALRISRAAPEWLETKASVRTIASAIKEAGIPARVSRDAGGFVCNHLYFGALQYLSDKRSAIPAVFVHLPVTPEQAPPGANEKRLTRTEASDALRAAAKAILDRAKDGEEA
jgi:pyroglutamyl-peptidase